MMLYGKEIDRKLVFFAALGNADEWERHQYGALLPGHNEDFAVDTARPCRR